MKIWQEIPPAPCVHIQLLQSCPTLRNPMDCSPPDSSVHGHSSGKKAGVGCHALLQGSSWARDRACVSCVSCIAGGFFPAEPFSFPPVTCSVVSDSFVTPWTIAHQTPLSMGLSRQEYWSGSPFPSPGDLPDPGIEPGSPALQVDSLLSEPLDYL